MDESADSNNGGETGFSEHFYLDISSLSERTTGLFWLAGNRTSPYGRTHN